MRARRRPEARSHLIRMRDRGPEVVAACKIHGGPEGAVDAETSSVENVLLDVRNADEWEAGHAPARSGSRSASSRALASSCR